jgi:hypothetical protein
MTSRRRFMAVCCGLAAWFWYTAGAFEQQRPPTPQPEGAGRPAVVVPSDFPWHTFELIERRYKIEAVRFKARDETGIDWWGSDEVMVRTDDAKGWTVSDEIGNIDSGDTHPFDPAKSCIVAVRPGIVVLGKTSVCDGVGEPAPLGFRVEMWEKDFSIFGFASCLTGGPPGSHSGPHCADDGQGDDFIGRAQIDLLAQELEAALPNVGNEHIETVVLNPCRGDVCDVTYGPDYSFTFRVTRLPDVRVGLGSVLDEAMRRIGARSELEAIVAGLRSLRAPSPRKIEPETVNPPPER